MVKSNPVFQLFRILSLFFILGFFSNRVSFATSNETQRAAIRQELASAAREFQVPRRLLEAVAFIESHWIQRIPSPEFGHSDRPPAYGVMGLHDDDWFGQSLLKAAALIRAPRERLLWDSQANIRGAAAYLRQLATDESARGAKLLLNSATSESADLIPWIPVLMSYSGIPDPEDAEIYAFEVLKTVASGYHRNGIVIESLTDLKGFLASRRKPKGLDDPFSAPPAGAYPNAHWDPSPNFTPSQRAPEYIVLHVTEGHFAGALSWLKSPRSKVSAQYLIRYSDGDVTQLVADHAIAWHARCWNSLAIGIEHEGFTETGEGFDEPLYSGSAQLVRFLAEKYRIPLDSDHIIGHNFWQTPAFKQQKVLQDCNNHTDPGPYWNWTDYFSLLGISG